MAEQKMTDEQLSQELNKSKGGRIGGKLLSLLGGAVILFGIILGGNMAERFFRCFAEPCCFRSALNR